MSPDEYLDRPAPQLPDDPASPHRLARLYFDYALTGILVSGREGIIQRANPAAASITGLEIRALQGRALATLFANSSRERLARHWSRLLEQGISQTELSLRSASEGDLIVEMASVQIDEGGFMHIFDDVTVQRRARDEVEKARVAAEHANRAKSEFLANISHEIRTPLNGILGLGQLALQEDLPPQAREYLDGIQRSGHALLMLVNDLLDAAKAEAGKLSVDPHPFRLDELLADMADLGTASSSPRVSVTFVRDPTLPAAVLGDRLRIAQCLRNLIGNAIKFTPEGSVTLNTDTTPQDGRDWLRFCVTDTGIGIAPEVMARLFEPFVQADASTSRRFGGSGLGLYLSRELARSMGGDLLAESTPGRGSRFTLLLPLIPATVSGDTAASGISDIPMEFRGRHILLADDDATNRMVAAHWLAKAGINVRMACNGREAVAMAQQAPRPALVLMDVQMPELDGLDATRELRAHGSTVPIIGLSAGVTRKEQEACLAAGMSDFLPKPIDLDELWGSLTRWLPPVPAGDETIPPANAPAAIDDPAIRAAIARSFIDNHGNDGLRLAQLLAAGRRDDARVLAHSLKGSAATLGLLDVSRLAATLEATLENHATDASPALPDGAIQRGLDAFRAAQADARPAPPGGTPTTDATAPLALVVEDDPPLAELLRFILEREGFRVETAGDGRQADRLIRSLPVPALAMLDVLIPLGNGVELIGRIRKQPGWNEVPILMLSGKGRDGDVAAALDAGADDYVVKPFQAEELKARLRRLRREPR